MIDFDELRDLANETRAYIQMSDDKAFALRAIVISHDVVLGIYPSAEGMGLNIMKYRAKLAGGRLAINEPAEGGTTVSCEMEGATESVHQEAA